ncbi:MAG: hypothetical protein MUE41_13555, partial [Gemmatimonadaceae bacterium]|nr:hypothetical protein [Gemmatimonadaceae bacterium]
VVVGVEQVRVAAKSGTLQLAFVGCDAAAHSRAKVDALLAARGVRVVRQYDVASLGAITGREAVAALGVTDAALARGMVEVLEGVEGQQHGSGGASRGRREAGSTGRAG